MKKYLVILLLICIAILFVGCKNMLKLDSTNSKNYKIVKETKVPEQNFTIVELVHEKTKAKVVLFVCDDENRVFDITFKTPVNNSKGMPHILEHSVLCGSRKYNVKDPFIYLAKSSLNTFLNALTYPDKTCYPVASANIKDFHNLVDVYLDAVFYPNVIKDKRLFEQEGWHYEITDKNDDLKVNGVVYNEMKGVFSDPDSLLDSAVLGTVFSDSTYQYESGGDPEEIINLSYEEFVDFHHKYYSASNAIIFYYGKLDYNEELSYLDREYLSKQEYVECDSDIRLSDNFVKNVEKVSYYNADSEDYKDKSYIARTYGLDFAKDSTKNIALQVLNYILFNAEGAILKDKLLNAGLGETINSSYDTSVKNSVYYIVAKNINESKKDEFVKTIEDTIKELIEKGIDKEKLKAALNIHYFNFAEGEFSSDPKGLVMILTSLETALYGGDYDTQIKYKEAFDFLNKVNLDEKDNYFTKLLQEVFIDNNHTCTNILNPKYGYLALKENKLNEILTSRKKSMSDSELSKIIDDVKALKEFQSKEDSKEELDTLPSLSLSDIDRDKEFIKYDVKNVEGSEVISSNENDKDIVYMNMCFDITDFSDKELQIISAMSYLISKIDMKDMSYHDFNNYVDLNTGGLSLSIDAYQNKVFLAYKLKVTEKNIEFIFDIFDKLCNGVIFEDKDRISILLNEFKSNAYQSLMYNGHNAAGNRALSSVDKNARIADLVARTGVGFNLFIDKFSKNYKDNYTLINETFSNLYKKIMLSDVSFQYCVNEKYDKRLCDNLKNFIMAQKEKRKNIVVKDDDYSDLYEIVPFDDFIKKVRKEAIITPNDINFCAAASLFDKDKYNGRFRLLKTIFSYEYLWTNLRVLGGAYGCFFTSDRTGNYSFVSYRDPNLSKTNKVYIGVKDFLHNFDKTDEELTNYIIGTMGTFDNPLTTYSKFVRNISAYYSGITNDDYNKERHDVLDAKVSDIKEMENVFSDVENVSFCALIAEKCIEEAKREYDSVWKISR